MKTPMRENRTICLPFDRNGYGKIVADSKEFSWARYRPAVAPLSRFRLINVSTTTARQKSRR